MIKLFPLYYIFQSRYYNSKKLFHFGLLYIFPSLLFHFIYFAEIDFINTFSFYLIYELGYIDNDKQSDSRSKNFKVPTFDYFKRKSLINLLIIFVLMVIQFDIVLTISLIFLFMVFFIHNRLKKKYRIITYFILTSMRISSPIKLCLNNNFVHELIFHLVNMSLIKTFYYRFTKSFNNIKIGWSIVISIYLLVILIISNI